MGGYTLGTIGSILSCKALNANYPSVVALAKAVHDKRGESALSHPVKTKAKVVVKPTGRIKFGYLHRAKKLIVAALRELEAKRKW